jgi:inner membrane protein
MHVAHEHATDEIPSGLPLASASLAACFGCLPDKIEPALHPNHRQFFHSFAFGALVIYAGKKVYDWQPEDDFGKAARYVALVGIAAYGVHLAMDALTKKSLPLVGKL